MVLGMMKKRVFADEGETRPSLFVSRAKKKEMGMKLVALETSPDTMLVDSDSYWRRCDGWPSLLVTGS